MPRPGLFEAPSRHLKSSPSDPVESMAIDRIWPCFSFTAVVMTTSLKTPDGPPTNEVMEDPNAGLVLYVTPVSDHPVSVTLLTYWVDDDELVTLKRRLASVMFFPESDDKLNFKYEILTGLPSILRVVLVPKLVFL